VTGRGRPAAGYVTKRLAADWLRGVMEEARRGTLPGMVRTGATFADAAAEWLRYIEHDRMRKPSTVSTYQSLLGSQILPTFADLPIESITPTMIRVVELSLDDELGDDESRGWGSTSLTIAQQVVEARPVAARREPDSQRRCGRERLDGESDRPLRR